MKQRQKQLITVVGLVALALVVGVAGLLLAVLPQRAKAHALDREIAAAQTKLASLRAERHGPTIRAAQLFQLARAMPDTTDMPGLILDLARAAQDSNVSLLSVGPQTAVPQLDGASGLPLKIEINGSWNGIATFLHALRSNVQVNGRGKLFVDGRLFTVDNVALTPNNPTTSTPGVTSGPQAELTAVLSVNAFSYGVPVLTTTTTATGGTTTTTTTTTTTPGSVSAAGATG